MISSTLRRRRNVGTAEFNNHSSLQCTNEYDVVVNQVADCVDSSVTHDDPAENRDLISPLSDEILIKILGYLPTSCAISTSVLSTRWRNLYKQVPNIDLSCSTLLRRIPVDCGSKFLSQKTSLTNLPKFVSKIEWGIGYFWGRECVNQDHTDLIVRSLDTFLSLRSGSKIHSARLNCCLVPLGKSASTQFEQCVYALGRLGIEKLVLHCSCQEWIHDIPGYLSQILRNMPSLKYLKLGGCSVEPNLRGQCNSLQTLVLFKICLYRGALDCILSNCPSLRALTIGACNIYSSKLIIRGPDLELKYLNIYDWPAELEIVLCASNLLVFKFSSYRLTKLTFYHVPKLQSVYLDTPRQIGIMNYVCGELANDLPHLKSLQLVHAFSPFKGIIDMFNNLRRLDLTLMSGPEMTDLLVLTPLLQNFPLLQDFHLSKLDPDNFCFSPRGKKQDIVLHSELKKVEITGFIGTENDIEFALYILKSAIKLEEMHITPCTKKRVGYGRWNPVYEKGRWSEERQRTILTRLQRQAVSKTAQLFFQHKHQIISAIEEDCDYYV